MRGQRQRWDHPQRWTWWDKVTCNFCRGKQPPCQWNPSNIHTQSTWCLYFAIAFISYLSTIPMAGNYHKCKRLRFEDGVSRTKCNSFHLWMIIINRVSSELIRLISSWRVANYSVISDASFHKHVGKAQRYKTESESEKRRCVCSWSFACSAFIWPTRSGGWIWHTHWWGKADLSAWPIGIIVICNSCTPVSPRIQNTRIAVFLKFGQLHLLCVYLISALCWPDTKHSMIGQVWH